MDDLAARNQFHEEPMRFSAEEFFELAKHAPIADHSGKVELVDGVIVRMSPALNPHAKYHSQLMIRLSMAYGEERPDSWVVRVELTLRLGNYTTRDADIAVIRNPGDDQGAGKPHDVLMVVEIAHTSLEKDLGPKRANYATAGIPHYWVVDVEGRQVRQFTQPMGDRYDCETCINFGTLIDVPETDTAITVG